MINNFNLDNWFNSLDSHIIALYNKTFSKETDETIITTINELLIRNFTLWQYEDNARRKDVKDEVIADIKRNIDKNNQLRHNTINKLDFLLREDIEKKLEEVPTTSPLNSETPASIFDRLIILALRIHHLEKETKRQDTNTEHIEKCGNMLREVKEKSIDLIVCLKTLLEDYYNGKKRLKSYSEHKLYNDPELNPAIRNNQ